MRARQRFCGVFWLRGRLSRLGTLTAGLAVLSWAAALAWADDDPPAAEGMPSPTGPVLRRPEAAGGPQPLRRTTSSPQTPCDRGILQRGPRVTATPPPASPVGLSRPASVGQQQVTPVTSIQPAAPVPQPPGQFWVEQPFHHHPEPQYDEKPICALSTNILPSRGDLPANYAAARFDKAGQELHTVGTSRPWAELVYDWEATSFCCAPLYFEEPNAERVGHSAGYFFQPILSGAHFFARIPALPYMMTAEPPFTCVYTLGHDRPGSYAPFRYIRLPISLGAGTVEAVVITGLVYLIP